MTLSFLLKKFSTALTLFTYVIMLTDRTILTDRFIRI